MSKKRIYLIGVITLILITSYYYFSKPDDENIHITSEVKKGTFINEVIISGEAQSTSLKKAKGPSNESLNYEK